MKTIFITSFILSLILLSNCSSINENNDLVTIEPKDIFWTKSGLDSCWIYSMVSLLNGNLIVGTNYGMYKSTDDGLNWDKVKQDSIGTATCFYLNSNGKVFIGTYNKGIFVSSDNGNSWTNLGLQNVNISSISVDASGKIFVGTRGNGIFASGSNYDWKEVNPDFNYKIFPSLLINSQNIIFAGDAGVYKSDDGGKSWSLKINGLGYWSVQSLLVNKNGNLCAGTDQGGFFLSSNNGESWTKFNNGLINTEITALAMNDLGHIFSGTWRGGTYRTVDNGLNWESIDSGLTIKQVSSLIISKENYLFAGTSRGVFKAATKN
jgi:ligand-binding sensor domain-containing protein